MIGRFYNVSDEQVLSLGFSTYEELEAYYDVAHITLFDDINGLTKSICVEQLVAWDLLDLVFLPREERLGKVLEHNVGGVITSLEVGIYASVKENIDTIKVLLEKIDCYARQNDVKMDDAKIRE